MISVRSSSGVPEEGLCLALYSNKMLSPIFSLVNLQKKQILLC